MTSYRQSPVSFPGAVRLETRNGFDVVLEYQDQGEGPWLVDLSHKAKWDLQDSGLDRLTPWGISLPERPGECLYQPGLLLMRLNRTQARVWDLGGEAGPVVESCATDVSDTQCLLALCGGNGLELLERITPLDAFSPHRPAPCLVQGPVLHIPCQTVRLTTPGGEALLIAFSRGYGRSMAEALLDACADTGLRPGGEDVFNRLLTEA